MRRGRVESKLRFQKEGVEDWLPRPHDEWVGLSFEERRLGNCASQEENVLRIEALPSTDTAGWLLAVADDRFSICEGVSPAFLV